MNHLVNEKSPYLRQHLDNPVDWYPWGDQAFALARQQDKPIFLSVGYAACHWCHVMAHESFEDREVAELLNRHFVSIKLDREERPDIDHIYMNAVQMMTGRGGWPMSVVMTPAGEPFFGGTYFPKPHFISVLTQLAAAWRDERAKVDQVASQMMAALRERPEPLGAAVLDQAVLLTAIERASANFDQQWGGFGGAPKFPPAQLSRLLMRLHLRSGRAECLAMVRKTLDAMASGGMYDHLGGGFHRYSTDQYWRVPHFEKMLYDNALLASAYLEAFELTSDSAYRQVACETLDYMLAQMQSAQGGLYCAEDADSEGHEGKFYVWSWDELQTLLNPAELACLSQSYDVHENGNFEGANILYLRPGVEWQRARAADVSAIRQKLFQARAQRERPLCDDKILVSWNGLAIEALAQGYRATGRAEYLGAAQRAAEFIRTKLWSDGRLLRRYRDGEARFAGLLEDYAYLIQGLLALYEAAGKSSWLEWAREIQQAQDRLLWEEQQGAYRASTDQSLPVAFTFHDDPCPNPNGVSALNLLRFDTIRPDQATRARAQRIIAAGLTTAQRYPTASASLLLALDFEMAGARSVVGLGAEPPGFFPYIMRVVGDDSAVAKPNPGMVYICERGRCLAPISDPAVLANELSQYKAL